MSLPDNDPLKAFLTRMNGDTDDEEFTDEMINMMHVMHAAMLALLSTMHRLNLSKVLDVHCEFQEHVNTSAPSEIKKMSEAVAKYTRAMQQLTLPALLKQMPMRTGEDADIAPVLVDANKLTVLLTLATLNQTPKHEIKQITDAAPDDVIRTVMRVMTNLLIAAGTTDMVNDLKTQLLPHIRRTAMQYKKDHCR